MFKNSQNLLSVFKKVHYILILCFVFSLPFSFEHIKINSLLIILLTVNSVALNVLSGKVNHNYWKHLMLILFVIVYFVFIIGAFYSNNPKEASAELQRKLSLFIFPVILYYSPRLDYKEVRKILLCFVSSCTLTATFCGVIATARFLFWNDSSFFFYHNFSGIVGMHATYLSMYFSFSIVILLFVFSKKIHSLSQSNKVVYYMTLSVLIISVLLLAARMQIVILIMGSILYAAFCIEKNASVLKSVMKTIGLIIFILSLVFIFPKNRERFKEAINYDGQYAIDKKWGDGQMRYLMWDCALELVKMNLYIGVGTGDVQDELQKCYVKNEYTSLTYWKNTRFNAHNQFLEIAIELGIIGLTLFLVGLIIPVIDAFRQKKVIYIVFLVFFALSCLTESLLERQSGIVFFAFFNSLFAFNPLKED